ncbi:MAG: hypothetical protein V1804_01460 [Patescibacteria group bacterium]
MPKGIKIQRKMGEERESGYKAIRVTHRKEKGKKLPRYLLKCGCHKENNLEIYYDEEGLEIGDINGSVKNWREILLPLLGFVQSSDGTVLRKGDFVSGSRLDSGTCQGVFIKDNGDGSIELSGIDIIFSCNAIGVEIIPDQDIPENTHKKVNRIRESHGIKR